MESVGCPISGSCRKRAAMSIKVDQEVWVFDVNDRGRGPDRGIVTKVGRKLVTIKYGYGERTFRIEDGQRNDNYRHQWFLTDEQYALGTRRKVAVNTIRDVLIGRAGGIKNGLPIELIESVAALLERNAVGGEQQ